MMWHAAQWTREVRSCSACLLQDGHAVGHHLRVLVGHHHVLQGLQHACTCPNSTAPLLPAACCQVPAKGCNSDSHPMGSCDWGCNQQHPSPWDMLRHSEGHTRSHTGGVTCVANGGLVEVVHLEDAHDGRAAHVRVRILEAHLDGRHLHSACPVMGVSHFYLTGCLNGSIAWAWCWRAGLRSVEMDWS